MRGLNEPGQGRDGKDGRIDASITVGIPTHNRRETVLMAVQSAVEQTRPPDQVLVIADGCTDGTQEAIEALDHPAVDVLDLPKAPGYGYANRNIALDRARGDVFAWLGDDDLYLPDHLERIGELYDADVADVVQATACWVHPDDVLHGWGMDWSVPLYRELILSGHNRTPAASLTHLRSRAFEVGGWPEDILKGGDLVLMQRLVGSGSRCAMVAQPTVLKFYAADRDQPEAERVAQIARYLERLGDPRELAHLRAEMARGVHVKAAEGEEYTSEIYRQLVEALGERDDREWALQAITSGRWWRLHERIEPVLRKTRR
jgi:hypothetical protein